MSQIKMNTTPTLPIRIRTNYKEIKKIEFKFANSDNEYARVFLHKVIEGSLPIAEGATDDDFVILLELTANETLRLPVGDVYIDTRIERIDGKVPPTKMVKIENINSLFKEGG